MSTFDTILKKSELKNERTVAIVRFVIFGLISILDILSFFKIIKFTPLPPNLFSIFMDLGFFSFSLILLIILLKNKYFRLFKYISITIDYFYITIVILFDPTVPKEGEIIYWVVLVAMLFLYFLNLLRYSKIGTLYASLLTVGLFLGISTYLAGTFSSDLFGMLFSLSLMLFMGYHLTSSSKKMMEEANTKQMMERYFPPQLVGEFENKKANLEAGGKDQEVTILFSDIRSFTTLSEKLTAGEVVTLLNDYLSRMTDIIFSNNGTIDKFIGDAIMTLFGAPLKNDDDAYRAIRTALEMQNTLSDFNRDHPYTTEPLKVGIGIHTGNVIVGNIGSDKRFDYTVIGDNVNLSSRIEGMTKYYHCSILISQATYDKLTDHQKKNDFIIRLVDEVIVKGKSKSLRIYEVMGNQDDANRRIKIDIKSMFEKARTFYEKRDFVTAADLFDQIFQTKKDVLSGLYAKRCQEFTQSPPLDSWNGVTSMETK